MSDRVGRVIWDILLVTAAGLPVVSTVQGAVTHYEYNAAGDVTKTWVTDGVTQVARSLQLTEYDALGRQRSVTQVAEMSGAQISKARYSGYIYDAMGNLVTTTVATDQGSEMTFHDYDNLGRRITTRGPMLNGQSVFGVASYAYDRAGNVTRESVLVNGSTYAETWTVYDALNRAVTATDPEQNRTLRTYNSQGLLCVEQRCDGTAPAAQSRFVYDHLGRVVTRARLADPTATAIDVTVDQVSVYTYDAAGQQLTETTYDRGTAARTLVESREYDPLGRLTKVIDPKGYHSATTYDQYGRVITKTRADGNTRYEAYTYNAAGQVYQMRESQTVAGLNTWHLDTYSYDALGHRTRVDRFRTHVKDYQYDMAGRQTTATEAVGYENRRTDHVYSQDGKLAAMIAYNTGGNQTTSYTYSPLGVVTIDYPGSGDLILFDYYPNGAVSRKLDQKGQELVYSYDLRGLLTSKHVTGTPAMAGWTYAYDGLGRMTLAQTNDDGGASATSEVTYVYDALSRVVYETQMTVRGGPVRAIEHEYDQMGKRTKLTYPATQ